MFVQSSVPSWPASAPTPGFISIYLFICCLNHTTSPAIRMLILYFQSFFFFFFFFFFVQASVPSWLASAPGLPSDRRTILLGRGPHIPMISCLRRVLIWMKFEPAQEILVLITQATVPAMAQASLRILRSLARAFAVRTHEVDQK